VVAEAHIRFDRCCREKSAARAPPRRVAVSRATVVRNACHKLVQTHLETALLAAVSTQEEALRPIATGHACTREDILLEHCSFDITDRPHQKPTWQFASFRVASDLRTCGEHE